VNALIEFYANCSVTQGVVTSSVGGTQITFDAAKLGEILGVPATGFEAYVREDRTALAPARLLELARKLGQQPRLQTPLSIKKGDMLPLHQLLFWFVIKNVIPRGQGRNMADAFDQCLVDLLDQEEQINLPAIMIRHIARITNTTREHDLGYGFVLSLVFEYFGISLPQKVGAQVFDEIGSTTLMGCGFRVIKGAPSSQDQGPQTPLPTVSGAVPSAQTVDALLADQSQLKAELAEVKASLAEEKELNAQRHADILALLSALSTKLSPPSS
jgi:hypothetical protein